MKKLFKFAALVLGSTSCIANCPKGLSENANLIDTAIADQTESESSADDTGINALAFIQDLSKIHYL